MQTLTMAGIRGVVVLLAVLGTIGAGHAIEAAQDAPAPRTIRDGVFTEEQAQRGQASYQQSCAACHADDLLGAGGPALVGEAFMTRWNGSTADDIVQTIRRSMPQEAPGSLTAGAYVDIVSLLLKANGSPAGTTELPTDRDSLKLVRVTAP